MFTVVETPMFIQQANRNGLTDAERADIVDVISSNPTIGDLMRGTGGARKVRIAGRGHGTSGGYRVIYYYAAVDVPLFLLSIYSKGAQANLTQAQKNALSVLLPQIAAQYRNRETGK